MPRLALASSLVLFAACQSPPPAAADTALHCTLVLLRTGPAQGLDQAARQQAFAGHFANMQRLAEARQLLLAGPFGEQRSAADLRGVFVLDTADRRQAEQLAGSDPTAQAGVFRLEYHDLVTAAPLRRLLATELERLQAARRAGEEPKPGDGCRNYVLLTADDGERALRALQGHDAVCLCGRLDGGKALFVLDAERCAEVPARLGAAFGDVGPHALDDWFATDLLAAMRRWPS